MSEKPYNPEDPAFLISRSLDRDLSEDEHRQLDQVLSESEALRAEADMLRAVDRLIKRWAAEPVELDWEPHAAMIQARVTDSDDDQALRRIDDWLKRLGDSPVEVDGERFTAAVMAGIGAGPQRTVRSLIFRIGAPLAAAAAIAFALIATFWSEPSQVAVTRVVVGPAVKRIEGLPGAAERPMPIVSFSRSSDTVVAEAAARPGISAVWSASTSDWSDESPPL
jgi:hypothetical protein